MQSPTNKKLVHRTTPKNKLQHARQQVASSTYLYLPSLFSKFKFKQQPASKQKMRHFGANLIINMCQWPLNGQTWLKGTWSNYNSAKKGKLHMHSTLYTTSTVHMSVSLWSFTNKKKNANANSNYITSCSPFHYQSITILPLRCISLRATLYKM